MSKKVDRWLNYGKKRCAKGDHWFIMDYGSYLLCPICGEKQPVTDRNALTEYNGYLVQGMPLVEAKEECKHEPKLYRDPDEPFGVFTRGHAHVVYQCKKCGKTISMQTKDGKRVWAEDAA